jgi:hypothetical protein
MYFCCQIPNLGLSFVKCERDLKGFKCFFYTIFTVEHNYKYDNFVTFFELIFKVFTTALKLID